MCLSAGESNWASQRESCCRKQWLLQSPPNHPTSCPTSSACKKKTKKKKSWLLKVSMMHARTHTQMKRKAGSDVSHTLGASLQSSKISFFTPWWGLSRLKVLVSSLPVLFWKILTLLSIQITIPSSSCVSLWPNLFSPCGSSPHVSPLTYARVSMSAMSRLLPRATLHNVNMNRQNRSIGSFIAQLFCHSIQRFLLVGRNISLCLPSSCAFHNLCTCAGIWNSFHLFESKLHVNDIAKVLSNKDVTSQVFLL